jgi:prepilin-type N-terminal cleavage/methylation domain-containing protein
MNIKKSQSGFTLVEFAIVITIIALLLTGIIKSGDLVDSYRRQQVIKEYNQYLAAFRTFQGKYGSLPGDFAEASRIWPSQQNGNGNGLLDQGGLPYLEGAYAWGHLSSENLVSGNYSGNPATKCYDTDGVCSGAGGLGYTSSGYFITAEVDSPKAPTTTTATGTQGRPQWLATSFNYFNGVNYNTFDWNFNANYFQILNDYVSRQTGNQTAYASMNCKDVFLIDFKSDDARPFTGDVTVPVTGGCVAAVNDSAARGTWSYDSINSYTPTSVTMPMFRIGDSE